MLEEPEAIKHVSCGNELQTRSPEMLLSEDICVLQLIVLSYNFHNPKLTHFLPIIGNYLSK